MALASRLTLAGAPAEDPEDFFGASLAMFDDVINLRRSETFSNSIPLAFPSACPLFVSI